MSRSNVMHSVVDAKKYTYKYFLNIEHLLNKVCVYCLW